MLVDHSPETVELVIQRDGCALRLIELPTTYDQTDRIAASMRLQLHRARREIFVGLIYVDPAAEDLHHHLGTVQTALNCLDDAALIPGAKALERLNATLR